MLDQKGTNYEATGPQVCSRCGVHGEGEHPAPGGRRCSGCECVDALRAMIADLEFRLEKMMDKPAPKASNRGGRRNRRDARFVVLDGERLCLTDAARALGLSPSTLHLRIVARTHDPDYRDVDVRAVRADQAARGASQQAAN